MNHFDAKNLSERIAEFAFLECAAFAAQPGVARASPGVSSKAYANALDNSLRDAVAANLTDAVEQLAELKKGAGFHVDLAAIGANAATAKWALTRSLNRRKFLYVSEDRVDCLDKERLFGEEVYDSFPAAREDIREAGNCIAAECCTAAVFHLMRAAEVALRVLAVDRGAYPVGTVESKQWGEIVNKLTGYANGLSGEPASSWTSHDVRQAQIRSYQGAMVEFRAFNDAWRRHVSHAHEGSFYDRDMANSVLVHVRRFMRQLVRIPAHRERRFRSKVNTDSDRC
jgi:hypothetical protein